MNDLVYSSNLSTFIKPYIERTGNAWKKARTEITTLQRENAELSRLLLKRKKRRIERKVAMKDRYVIRSGQTSQSTVLKPKKFTRRSRKKRDERIETAEGEDELAMP